MEVDMFYPVRIFKPNGKMKKEISSEKLSERYWQEFNDAVRTNIQISPKGRRPKPEEVYEPMYDATYFSED